VVHSQTHPCSANQYQQNGYAVEILGSRDHILDRLQDIPYGQYVFEFILPCGYQNEQVELASAGEFLFLRDWDSSDHSSPSDTWYSPWDEEHGYYGIGGFQTKSYDSVFQARDPAGRFFEEDVAELNGAFDQVRERGGIFYAMFHSDRYDNSVIYDTRPGIDGVQGSSLMVHWEYVSGRPEVYPPPAQPELIHLPFVVQHGLALLLRLWVDETSGERGENRPSESLPSTRTPR
jgi:hypothetical protein